MFDDNLTGPCLPEGAYIAYDIAISGCGKPAMKAGAVKNCGDLTFAPGCVSDGNVCDIRAIDICIPSCGRVKPTISVTLEDPCYCTAVPCKPDRICLCEQVCKRLTIPGFICLCDSYVYHTDVKHYSVGFGNTIAVGYGITVKYIDNGGKKRSKDFGDTIIFFPPDNAGTDSLSVQFDGFNCCCIPHEKILVSFRARLYFKSC